VGSARQLHLVVSPSCPLASYQKKEIKKRGSKRIRLPRATQSREAPPPPPWLLESQKRGKLSKKKKVDSPKKEKKRKKGSPKGQAPTHCIKASFLFRIFFSFLDNAEPLFCFVCFRTRNQQHLIVFSTIIQLRIIV
jgi:hypothetical protein